MSIHNLSVELVSMIWKNLDKSRDRNAFVRTCRDLYWMYGDDLYSCAVRESLGDSIIRHAIIHGPLTTVQRVLNTGFRGYSDEGLSSSLCSAARYGREDVLRLLLEEGADNCMEGEYGEPAVEVAVIRGPLNVLAILLEYGQPLEVYPLLGANDLLRLAVDNGHAEMVRFLLEKNVPVNGISRMGFEGTALMRAVYSGGEEIVHLLLEAGADVHATDHIGNSSLHQACRSDHPHIMAMLLEMGADTRP
ncbi:ankyrin repeat-containing domain protein [Aspergillus cavernicola]|uniref:Ankyrin repeat-containing domain protein n=1 Tax=Aspergillus cavernicola TaxID=176166 RepID=A0ABR4ICS2_9EURO